MRVEIRSAENGYIVQESNNYGTTGEPEIFNSFEDVVKRLAELSGETEFAGVVEHAYNFSRSLAGYIETVSAPRLMAIEAKINPGSENIVNEENEDLF